MPGTSTRRSASLSGFQQRALAPLKFGRYWRFQACPQKKGETYDDLWQAFVRVCRFLQSVSDLDRCNRDSPANTLAWRRAELDSWLVQRYGSGLDCSRVQRRACTHQGIRQLQATACRLCTAER